MFLPLFLHLTIDSAGISVVAAAAPERLARPPLAGTLPPRARTASGLLPGPPGTRARVRPYGLSSGTRPGGRRAPRSAAAAAAGVGARVRVGRRRGFATKIVRET